MSRVVVGINTDSRTIENDVCTVVHSDYVNAVYEAGAQPVLLPCIPDRDLLKDIVSGLSACVFTGGRDYPAEIYGERHSSTMSLLAKERVETDMILAELVLATEMPVLGICGGMELINIASGGKLITHLAAAADHTHEKYHDIKIESGSILKLLFSGTTLSVNSSHHQAVNPSAVGKGLRIVARAADKVVEAIEGEDERFLLGVQWHPERINDQSHRRAIFSALVTAARR
jgi:putative glutamine amidotransferase